VKKGKRSEKEGREGGDMEGGSNGRVKKRGWGGKAKKEMLDNTDYYCYLQIITHLKNDAVENSKERLRSNKKK
jgi:hypothetical protein